MSEWGHLDLTVTDISEESIKAIWYPGLSDAEIAKRRKRSQQERRRRARFEANGPMDSDITIDAVAERDGWDCSLCGAAIASHLRRNDRIGPSVDHIVTSEDGGTHTWDNVRLAHRFCNSDAYSAGHRPPAEMFIRLCLALKQEDRET